MTSESCLRGVESENNRYVGDPLIPFHQRTANRICIIDFAKEKTVAVNKANPTVQQFVIQGGSVIVPGATCSATSPVPYQGKRRGGWWHQPFEQSPQPP